MSIRERVARLSTVPNFADFQTGIYLAGLGGEVPPYPLTFAGLEAAAKEKLRAPPLRLRRRRRGDEHTQRGNVAAFERWGILPRMLAGAADRDLTVDGLRPDPGRPRCSWPRSACSAS